MRNKLKKIQNDKNLTMYELALDIGISPSTLRNFYLGKPLLEWNIEKIEDFIKEQEDAR